MRKLWYIAAPSAFVVVVLLFFLYSGGPRQEPQLENIPNNTTSTQAANSNPDNAAYSPRVQTPSGAPAPSAKTEEDPSQTHQAYHDYVAEERYALNKEFEAAALETFPVHTVQTHDPRHPEAFGPKKGEIWVRVKVEEALWYKDIMAETAELYRELTYYDEPVTVMHWVGNRPYAKLSFPEAYDYDQ